LSDLIQFRLSLDSLAKQHIIRQIMSTNAVSGQFGLALNEADAEQILAARHIILKNLGRVEVESGVISQLIIVFCRSPFINQENYTSVIIDLIEAFYYFKNETRDEISDMELIELMKERFDNYCAGSTELLVSRELEDVLQAVRQEKYYSTLCCDQNEVSE